MQKNSNRRGLVFAAVASLVASVFTGLPANAAAVNGANIGIYPALGSTSANAFVGTLAEDFPLLLQLKNNVSITDWDNDLVIKVEKTAGVNMDLGVSVSAAVTAFDAFNKTQAAASFSADIQAGSASATVSGALGGNIPVLNLKSYTTSGVASWSPITVTITAWLDNQGGFKNDVIDSDEWFTTQTVTLVNPSALAGAVTLTQPNAGDTTLTVSSTLTTGLNMANLSGKFFLAVSSSADIYTDAADEAQSVSPALSSTTVGLRAGVVSYSFPIVAISASQTVSAALRYTTEDGSVYTQGYLVGSVANKVASAATADALYAQVVKSNNSTVSSGTVAVRPNQTYTVRVGASTGSASVSGAVISVKLSGPTLTLPYRSISINGGAATTSYPTALAVTTGADGFGSFTITTAGFTDSEQIAAVASFGNVSTATVTLVATTPAYAIGNDYDLYSATPGATVNLGYTVKDQWGVSTSRTDLRIKLTRSGTGFNYSETVSAHAVVAGAATVAFANAKTGSALIDSVLEKYNQDTGVWEVVANGAGDQVTVNITSDANAFSTASALASVSASISYSLSEGVLVNSGTLTGNATVAGADIVISAPGLVITDVIADTTASGVITVRSNSSKQYQLKFAGNKSGTYTVSHTIGSATTTSLVIISPAASTSGKVITFDTTNIKQGTTATITGTLTDVLGNPVETTGDAKIAVTYTGVGIAIGTMPDETDEDGEFSFTVLVGSNDSGTATVTATYYKAGVANTAAADRVTATQKVTIGAETVVEAEQKLTIGTFNGYIAIYAKGYEGSKLSAKVAGKWLTVAELSNFQRVVRKTGAGYEIKVDLYIDGVFAKTQTTTTK